MREKHAQFLSHITNIHQVLAHSYLVYFTAAIFGLIFDYFHPYRVFSQSIVACGPVLLLAGTALIYWAQHTSEVTGKEREVSKEVLTPQSFKHGPYRYMRSPTHVGLALLVLGFGLIMNSSVIVIAALVSFVLTRYLYVRREEEILENRYGQAYTAYKKEVRF